MNSDFLHTYAVVCRLGSFSRAEAVLFLSRQAIMQQMNTLEAEVGLPLLQRTKRGVCPTPAGRAFYEGALQLLALEKAVIGSAKQAEGISPRLRLSNIEYHVLLAPITEQFRKLYPSVEVRLVLHPDTLEANLVEQNIIDVGDTLYFPQPKDSGLVYEKMLDMPYLCLLPVPWAKSSITPAEAAAFAPVADSREFSRHYADHLQKLSALIPCLEVLHHRGRRVDMIYEALQAGRAVVTASTFAGQLAGVSVLPLAVDFKQECGLVYRKNPSPEVRDYIDLARFYYRSGT